jgi:hypothetical protein
VTSVSVGRPCAGHSVLHMASTVCGCGASATSLGLGIVPRTPGSLGPVFIQQIRRLRTLKVYAIGVIFIDRFDPGGLSALMATRRPPRKEAPLKTSASVGRLMQASWRCTWLRLCAVVVPLPPPSDSELCPEPLGAWGLSSSSKSAGSAPSRCT